MKNVCAAMGVLGLAVLSFGQSSAPVAGSAALPAPDGRVSNSHIHLISSHPDAQRRFCVDIMGAAPQSFGKVKMADLPGVTLLFSSTDAPAAPYRKVSQMGFALAFLTDPWGTRIELTEHPASAASARQ